MRFVGFAGVSRLFRNIRPWQGGIALKLCPWGVTVEQSSKTRALLQLQLGRYLCDGKIGKEEKEE